MMKKQKKVISHRDAMKIIELSDSFDIKFWKMSTGEIVEVKGAVYLGGYMRRGTHLIKIPASQQIRRIRDIMIFEINGQTIYL